jgi:hypothetical protein
MVRFRKMGGLLYVVVRRDVDGNLYYDLETVEDSGNKALGLAEVVDLDNEPSPYSTRLNFPVVGVATLDLKKWVRRRANGDHER